MISFLAWFIAFCFLETLLICIARRIAARRQARETKRLAKIYFATIAIRQNVNLWTREQESAWADAAAGRDLVLQLHRLHVFEARHAELLEMIAEK